MSRHFALVKARSDQDRAGAYRTAALNLQPHLGVEFNISSWSNKAARAFDSQWAAFKREVEWDWSEIFQAHRDFDRLDMAIWNGERLCGLGLGLTTASALDFRFLEGCPDPVCPLKGRRILIAMEAAACYAQARGKKEIRVSPINSSLESLYRDTYGFDLETPRKGEPYYRKGV